MNILIAGLPKTGTTGLVQYIFNSLEGKVDIQFEGHAFVPPKGNPDHVLAKILINETAYTVDLDSYREFEKRIFIIRDPRDALISGHLYRFFDPVLSDHPDKVSRYLAALEAKEQEPLAHSFLSLDILVMSLLHNQNYAYEDQSIREHLKEVHTRALVEDAARFAGQHPDFFIFRYEDMVSGQFSALESYLGVSIQTEEKFSRKVTLSKQRVRRTGSSGDWKNWFTQDDVDFFQPAFGPPMEDLGYEPDWSLPDSPTLAPATGSDYIRKLIHERHNPPPPTLKTRFLKLFKPRGSNR